MIGVIIKGIIIYKLINQRKVWLIFLYYSRWWCRYSQCCRWDIWWGECFNYHDWLSIRIYLSRQSSSSVSRVWLLRGECWLYLLYSLIM